MILFANWLVEKFADKLSMQLIYTSLFLALIASYLLPVNTALESLGSLASLLIATITLLPMFCAALIFGKSFAVAGNAGRALGFNLFGAVIGAMLEYLSNYTGVNNLLIVGALLYALSFACVIVGNRSKA